MLIGSWDERKTGTQTKLQYAVNLYKCCYVSDVLPTVTVNSRGSFLSGCFQINRISLSSPITLY